MLLQAASPTSGFMKFGFFGFASAQNLIMFLFLLLLFTFNLLQASSRDDEALCACAAICCLRRRYV